MVYSEVFLTVQGEGIHTGVPSVFFRVTGCNLRCAWSETNLCDTPYTSWNPEGNRITVIDAAAEIVKLGRNADHVVITGGEPFLYKDELQDLCSILKEHNKTITIETNATIYKNVKADLISMSPKLASSTPSKEQHKGWHFQHERSRLNTDVIKRFMRSHKVQVKFVVSCEKDLDEINKLRKSIPIPKQKIVLMPEGITTEQVRARQEWLVNYCIKEGYRYSDRLHVQIWNDKRGV